MTCPQVIKVITPGPPGPAGPTGIGSAWLQDAGAPDAEVGSNGDFYLDTETGNIYGPKADGAWGSAVFNIAEGQQGPAGPAGATGATGPAGVDGRTVLNGSGAPSNGLGAIGDFYIDIATARLYGPKLIGGWGGGISLIGPAGATGAQGPQGNIGPTGPRGADAVYSDNIPQALGVASAGVAGSAARSDHVHQRPTASEIGAATIGLAAGLSIALG